jgi:Ca2+-transporting ATPase
VAPDPSGNIEVVHADPHSSIAPGTDRSTRAPADADPELHGLSADEARRRLARFGLNQLPPAPRERLSVRIARQLREPMALLLIGAAIVSGVALGERVDAIAIVAIVLLNAAIGLAQEGKAVRALDALRSLETPTARVRRDGRAMPVPATELVPGDLILLAAGDRIPADAGLARASAFEADESLLTGESLPVAKLAAAASVLDEVPDGRDGPPDRPTDVFAGTLVTRGSGAGVVFATGRSTELGAIAAGLADREPPTPLQVELARLTARLGVICIVIAGAVFGLTLLRAGFGGQHLRDAFLSAVALAVAAVPEGLATVVLVALALGVRRMAGRRALVRRLPAVETLGCTTVVATDKTGTLTENRMRLEAVMLPGGEVTRDLTAIPRGLWRVAVLCNDAEMEPPSGDPLEVALLEAAGEDRVRTLRAGFPRIAELPFDSERRTMTTVHRDGAGSRSLVKGAPEAVLAGCSAGSAGVEGSPDRRLDLRDRDRMLAAAEALAAEGFRVLALAERSDSQPPAGLDEADRNLVLVGMVGLKDPVRPEAARAVAEARAAGVRVVMVTGDHPGTAAAVAEQAGLVQAGEPVVTGEQLRRLGPTKELLAAKVFARLAPDQKLELVKAFQAAGEVVAVTGDGANDAPALRRADIGVAMGRSGSDVAREAADMVIGDDDLATIVLAVREGRGIYDNIRKLVDYLVQGTSRRSPSWSARCSCSRGSASRCCRSNCCGSTCLPMAFRASPLGWTRRRRTSCGARRAPGETSC